MEKTQFSYIGSQKINQPSPLLFQFTFDFTHTPASKDIAIDY